MKSSYEKNLIKNILHINLEIFKIKRKLIFHIFHK